MKGLVLAAGTLLVSVAMSFADPLDVETIHDRRTKPAPAAPEPQAAPVPQIPTTVARMPSGEPVRHPGRRPFFLQVDFISLKDALEVDEALKETTSSFHVKSIGTFAGSTELEDTPMFTVGAVFPVSHRFDAGWALGYLQFDAKGQMRHQVSTQAFEEATGAYEVTIIRITNHLRYRRKAGRHFEFRARGGVGLAHSQTKASISLTRQTGPGSGTFFINPTSISDDVTRTAFTWDIAPSIAYVTDEFAVDLGLSFTDFGDTGTNDDLPGITLAPIGARISVEF